MINPDELDTGRLVIYVPTHANGNMGHPDCEEGVLTAFDNNFCWVRYGPDLHSKATLRENLEWAVLST